MFMGKSYTPGPTPFEGAEKDDCRDYTRIEYNL